jgi:phage terminase large subunit
MASNLTIHKEDYFPHQWDFLKSKKQINAYVGGFGSGKTYSFLHKTFINHITRKNKDGISNGWIIYPTYSLAEEVFVPPFLDILTNKGIKFDYNVSKHTIKTIYGNIKIFQMVKPQSIVGVSLSYCGFDEFDISTHRYCEVAFNKALGRMRDCENPEIYICTTPEGMKYTYTLMVEKADDNKFLVRGKTQDNVYLPKSYLKLLEKNYDKRLLKAYRDGEFVNLQQGQTYYQFNRDTNVGKVEYNRGKPVRFGIDFNCDPECAILFQLYEQQPQIRVFDCIALTHSGSGDLLTERMVSTIKQKYPNSEYVAYPDATGIKRGSSSMFSDIDIIRKGGIKVKALKSNPAVIDRVNAVNKALDGNLIIDTKCKALIQDLEKVVNKQGTREIDKSNKELTHMSDALGYAVHWEKPILKQTLGSIKRL